MNKRKMEQVKTILQAIQSGAIVRGGKLLSERELEAYFNMSRLHIRECLIILEAYGVLEIRERQGIFVENRDVDNAFRALSGFQSSWPIGLYAEISEVRNLVEIPAARLAAARRNDADVARMKECLQMMESVIKLDSPERGIKGSRWNSLFHNLIATAAHNMVLLRAYEGLIALSQNTIDTLHMGNFNKLPQDAWPESILEEHRKLAEAIFNQDAELAGELMNIHLERTDYRYHLSCCPSAHQKI